MGMVGTIPIKAQRQAPFAGFFSRLLESVQGIFRKPPLPDPSVVLSEIKRVNALLLERPSDRQMGRMMQCLVNEYENQTREVAMRQIRNAPRLKAKIMQELRENRRKAYELAFEATADPYYAAKLGHYDARG